MTQKGLIRIKTNQLTNQPTWLAYYSLFYHCRTQKLSLAQGQKLGVSCEDQTHYIKNSQLV